MSRRSALNRILFSLAPMRPIGRRIYAGQSLRQVAAQSTATQFYRNLDQLAVFDGPLSFLTQASTLRVLVAGCSMGCEAYTLAGYLRHRHPGLALAIDGNDIDEAAIAVARSAVYGGEHGLARPLPPAAELLKAEMFTVEGDQMRIVPDLATCVRFETADVLDPSFARYRNYDVVFGQNFMIHMDKKNEARAFANLVDAARPGGVLFVGGMHLDSRPGLVRANGLQPVNWNIAAIHDGDTMRRNAWPWHYWSLEPFDPFAPDALSRYATIFTKPEHT